jgi:hypothetical protein
MSVQFVLVVRFVKRSLPASCAPSCSVTHNVGRSRHSSLSRVAESTHCKHNATIAVLTSKMGPPAQLAVLREICSVVRVCHGLLLVSARWLVLGSGFIPEHVLYCIGSTGYPVHKMLMKISG